LKIIQTTARNFKKQCCSVDRGGLCTTDDVQVLQLHIPSNHLSGRGEIPHLWAKKVRWHLSKNCRLLFRTWPHIRSTLKNGFHACARVAKYGGRPGWTDYIKTWTWQMYSPKWTAKWTLFSVNLCVINRNNAFSEFLGYLRGFKRFTSQTKQLGHRRNNSDISGIVTILVIYVYGFTMALTHSYC